ncbi:DUF2974 domain-containing protein [Gemella cuniculi]|uniref:DUF2974 domain-containing protein n=1 Tax=Gemella cuniculi TaxID=150240 RepID=UPI0003F54911|nr:DUF2974 domain-containing protein [Gemella cuniculi]
MEKDFDVTSNASFIVYRIEMLNKIKAPRRFIYEYIELQKKVGKFPNELEFLSSFYDNKTGSSGSFFRNTKLDNYILAYTGTNFYFDREKDMYADVVGICLGQGEHYTPCYRFYKRMVKKYGDNVILTGHSLGGNIAQRVALEYNVQETVVYNAAPLYLVDGIDIFMNKEDDNLLYKERMTKYRRNINKIYKKQQKFTGCVKRIVSENDVFTRIAELLGIGYYIGDEYIIKEAGMHGIKSFLGVHQTTLSSLFGGEAEMSEYLSSEYKEFSLEEISLLRIFSKGIINSLEGQLKTTLKSQTMLNNLNKNPYKVNFEKFLTQLLEKIEEQKQEKLE